MKLSISSFIAATCLLLATESSAFAPSPTRRRVGSTQLFMQQPPTMKERQPSDLSAYALDVAQEESFPSSDLDTSIPASNLLENFLLPVLSTSMLITGNTVGAGMLVLPELAAEPGMAVASSVFLGAYFMNWISGLCIAQVAIQQHERSGDDVPSSFKEFAQANLFESASIIVSGISIFVNSLVLAFDTTKAGQVGARILGDAAGPLDGSSLTYLWAALMLGVVSTQSLERLSQVASLMVMGLFVSFAGLLLPGLAHVVDPVGVLTTPPPIDTDIGASVLHMAPVFVSTLVYQNIVPTVTRMLDYDRTKVVTAITLGSLVPLGMYLAWCVTALGGGLTGGALAAGPLLTVFSLVTVGGSSMGALMSLSEEFEILLGQDKKDVFSLPSVALPSLMALGACQLFANDINVALEVAGSYGSPLLYGLIPVAMAYLQRQREQQQTAQTTPSVVPGGMAGLGVLGAGATALVGSELFSTLTHAI